MTGRSQAPDPIPELTSALFAFDAARLALEAAAPEACSKLGGAEAIMDRLGGHMIRRGWWSIDFRSPDGFAIWEAISLEQQRPFRDG